MSLLIGNDEQAANTGKVSRHNTKKPCKISVNRIGFLLVFNIHDHFKYARGFFNMYTSRAGLYKKTSVRTSYLCCSIFLPKIPEI